MLNKEEYKTLLLSQGTTLRKAEELTEWYYPEPGSTHDKNRKQKIGAIKKVIIKRKAKE